ncbi:MAG: class II aldolase/adducin family protein [Ectothiorhodospiraceae bacterium]|nr:class II aldolase/adducin family protein [Ectothiorhodospiraceae bacterium]MCH8503383.1 class II aldolase/adducin family protein [Ectothiorhodospiraceae bacterium]
MDASSQYRQLVETAREIDRRGLNQGRSGNLSARHGEGMLISASGCQFDAISADDFVVTDLSGNGHGARQPSSEWAFHAAIYRQRPDAGAVVHVHSPWATTLACLRRPIPAFHYMVAVAGGHDIPCAPYATFGTDTLAEHVAGALRNRNACLLANHGQVALADTLSGALELAMEVELLARCYSQALSIGEPTLLTDGEMEEVLERFKGYWRNARDQGPH